MFPAWEVLALLFFRQEGGIRPSFRSRGPNGVPQNAISSLAPAGFGSTLKLEENVVFLKIVQNTSRFLVFSARTRFSVMNGGMNARWHG